jgi:histone H3/H4
MEVNDVYTYVNQTAVKNYCERYQIKLGGRVVHALNEKVEKILDKAITRAKQNRRITVLARDV